MCANYQLIGMGTYRLKGQECTQIIKSGLEIGYRQIDTAQLYNNHVEISLGIKLSRISHDEIFIISKISNQNISKLKIAESVDKIKKELEINYVNLILLHNPVKNYQLAWNELIRCKNHLNVKHIGVSNFGIEDLNNLISKSDYVPWLNQIELNIFNQQCELIQWMRSNNIIVQSHTTLTNTDLFENNKLNELANLLEISVPKLMYKYVLDQDIGILPKTSNLLHLQSNWDLEKYKSVKIFDTNFIETNLELLKLFDIKYKLYAYPKIF